MLIFILMTSVIAICCSAITIKTLVGYSSCSILVKALVTIFVTASWFAPVLAGALKKAYTNVPFVIDISYVLYFFFGLAFILFALLLSRDIVWYIGYGLKKLPDPKDVRLLNLTNLIAIIISFLIASYSLYEGLRAPRLKEVELTSRKVSEPFRIVLLTDTHINQGTTHEALKNLVARVNALEPDVILMVGDVIDDQLYALNDKVDELKEFAPKYGTYVSLGNHELYNGLPFWEMKFTNMGENTKLLTNQGIDIPEKNIHILGIPDTRIIRALPRYAPKLDELMKDVPNDKYKIIMSHAPDVAKGLPEGMFDLQVSGHTHGGQIFPFHIPAKMENKFLAGLYDERGTKVYVSRGAGYWGPPLRFLAPSEITLIDIKPEEK